MRFRESFRGFGKNQSGAVATEFAIVGTLFIVLIFVMIQMGAMFYGYSVMQTGARDGARRLAGDLGMFPNKQNANLFANATACDDSGLDATTVEGYTCSTMLLFAVADVQACITEDVKGVRYDAEVVVSVDMGDVGLFDLFGVTAGRRVTATAVMRVADKRFVELIDDADNPIVPFCSGSIPPIPL